MNSSTWGQYYVNKGAWNERKRENSKEETGVGRNVSMAVKRGIRSTCSVILLTRVICSRDMDMECSTAITN